MSPTEINEQSLDTLAAETSKLLESGCWIDEWALKISLLVWLGWECLDLRGKILADTCEEVGLLVGEIREHPRAKQLGVCYQLQNGAFSIGEFMAFCLRWDAERRLGGGGAS